MANESQGQVRLPPPDVVIHWLVEKVTARPELLCGLPLPRMLSSEEEAVFNRFKVLKRRQDWLLGRWTVKRLLQDVIRQESAQTVPFEAISVLAGKDGAPNVHFSAPYTRYESQFTVSISHSHGTAFCAVVRKPDWPMGVDMEWIETRSAQFAEQFFTEKEQTLLRQIPAHLTDIQVNALWSGKEAALKAVREGLRFDTRRVECDFGVVKQVPREWARFHICWNDQEVDKPLPSLQGWWRVMDDFVLTMATREEQEDYDAA